MKKHSKSPRRYSERTLKILWGRAAGKCAVPECRIDLVVDATDHDPIVVIGDIAHIEASSDKGPRANRKLSAKERDSYDNLILLCKNCHFRFDAQKKNNTVLTIKQLRAEHEAWVRVSLPERGCSTNGWNVLVLQGDHPVDAAQTVAALSPDYPRRKPTVISASANQRWPKTFKNLQKAIRKFLSQGDPFDSRFAIFPLAPVSACIATGYLLTNRPRVRLFQHHRIQANWTWPKAKNAPHGLVATGLPSKRTEKVGDVVICFNLSARVERADFPVPKKSLLQIVDVSVAEPSVHWLKSPNQLEALGDTATRVFASLLQHFPNATRWHLFFAGPAPGAVKVGQQLNPTMTPPTQLYEFNRAANPRYAPSILLTPPEPP
ncbi:MAG: SAVED domain-containing protein [Limisphaerales bacterium]